MRAPLAVSLVLAGLTLGSAAEACGLVFVQSTPERTFLSEERVLIVWNEQTKVEHFVREVRFEKANQAFGFIVPTPGKPEVAKVDKPPFADLERDAPFVTTLNGLGLGLVGGFGYGGGGGAPKAGVEVTKVQRIGRFKAFTLAAHDAAGFRRWLDENGFATNPELEKWLAHYVEAGFQFVAFRYDAKKDEDPGMLSETVRISFESELPFYPYYEPAPPAKQDARRLTTWFVSQHAMRPIAARPRLGATELVTPWFAGSDPMVTVASFAKTIGELGPLLPIDQPEVQVQVFRDHKVSREGFRDVLFVPIEPPAPDSKLDPATETKHRAMARWIDPTIAPPAPAKVVAPTPAAPAPTSPPRAEGCSYGSSASGLTVPIALALVWASRRRWRLAMCAALTLVSCHKEEPRPAPAPVPSLATPVAPSASVPSERETIVLHALQGIVPAQMPIEAGPWDDRVGLGSWSVVGKNKKTVRISEKSTSVAGALSEAVVKRILRANFPRFRACYEMGLKRDPAMAGTIEMKLIVDTSGAVESAALGKGTLTDAQVRACALGILRTLSFPEPETGKATISLTYEFFGQPS